MLKYLFLGIAQYKNSLFIGDRNYKYYHLLPVFIIMRKLSFSLNLVKMKTISPPHHNCWIPLILSKDFLGISGSQVGTCALELQEYNVLYWNPGWVDSMNLWSVSWTQHCTAVYLKVVYESMVFSEWLGSCRQFQCERYKCYLVYLKHWSFVLMTG